MKTIEIKNKEKFYKGFNNMNFSFMVTVYYWLVFRRTRFNAFIKCWNDGMSLRSSLYVAKYYK